MSEVIRIAPSAAPAAPSLTDECRREVDAMGVSLTQAAKGIGVSATALSQWLRGEYPGDSAGVDRKVERWLHTRREAARRSLDAAGLDVHRDLQVTETVFTALAHAQAVGDVVLVHGQSGAGKSWAARHYCRTHSAAHFASMTVAVRSLAGVLGRIGAAVGVGARHGSALEAETAIIARLQDRSAILVIDECHHLSARLLDELRCIRDEAGCGLALVGDDAVRMTLARCPQIVGRIGIRVGIPVPAEDDVVELLEGVLGRAPHKRETKAAMSIARGPGGLHALRRLLARAWMVAQAEGREVISADDLEVSADEEVAA